MALRLFVQTGALDPPPSVLIKGRRATLGRGAEVDVRLPDPSVSAHHATIIRRGEAYLLIDEGSTCGTGIGAPGRQEPVWLAPDSPRVIEEGERIFLGQIELTAHLEAADRGAPTGYDALPEALVTAGLTAVGLEPSEELVRDTLLELTNLPDERLPEEPESMQEKLSTVSKEDERAPWVGDAVVAAVALLVLGACAAGLYFVMRVS